MLESAVKAREELIKCNPMQHMSEEARLKAMQTRAELRKKNYYAAGGIQAKEEEDDKEGSESTDSSSVKGKSHLF